MSAASPDPTVCIPNIGPGERRKRLRGGVVQLVVSLAVLAALLLTGAERLWRLLLFLPLAGATTGFFQWREKTWLALSARGSRDMDDGLQTIDDAAVLAQVRLQARRAWIWSLASAAALTAATLLLPPL